MKTKAILGKILHRFYDWYSKSFDFIFNLLFGSYFDIPGNLFYDEAKEQADSHSLTA